MKNKKTKKGSVLAYALIVLAMLLAIATSMSFVTVTGKKSASATDFSVQAYQTADSGVLTAIKKINNNLNGTIADVFPAAEGYVCSNGIVTATGPSGSTYTLLFFNDTDPISGCSVLANTIKNVKSTGVYRRVVRAVEVAVNPLGSCEGGETSINHGGQTYGLVGIGDQCWFRENLNIGNKLLNASTMPSDPFDYDNIQKWCYDDLDTNCDSNGGLYTWAEANGLGNGCNTASCAVPSPNRGICPDGWHIPTHDDFTELELAVCTSGTCATDFPFNTTTTGWRGTDEGTRLRLVGAESFSVLLTGYRQENPLGDSYINPTYAYFWSSSQASVTRGRRRVLTSGGANAVLVNRSNFDKEHGLSVRCVKD